MNKIETFVYNIVRKNPAIKQIIRNLYQGCFDLLPRKSESIPPKIEYKENFFFGFHDISPLSKDESKLLAMHNTFDQRMPNANEGLEIGYFDFINGKIGKWSSLDKSYAWNFHKGCRLQWIDNSKVIFNTAKDGLLVSKILDVLTGKFRIIPYPIDTAYIDQKESIATSFSYERLERCMPGYGYPYKDAGFLSESAPKNTGLFIINLSTGEQELVVNLEELAIKVAGKIENEYLHFVTHSEFSQDGRYVSFLYRRIPKEGDFMKRRSVICVYDRNTKEINVLPSQESGSHYVWNNKNQIIASCNINGKNCHALFDINDLQNVKLIDPDHLNSDGHQSFITDSSFVTDTYPDKHRMASLFIADMETDTSRLLAKVYSPKNFQTKNFHCHIACDLHPRVIGKGKWVCFDSPRTGKRGLYIIPLN